MNLEKIADIMSGRTFKHGVTEDNDWTHFVVQLKDIDKDNVFRPFDWAGMCRANLGRSHLKNEIIPNDIIIVAKGMNKRAVLIEELREPMVPNQHFFIVRLHNHDEFHPPFIEQYFNSSAAQAWMKENSEGNYQNTMSKKVLCKLPIPEMVIEKQKGIAQETLARHRKIDNLQYEIEGLKWQTDKTLSDSFPLA
jgi:restriction endonuclease S subunit